MKKIAFIILLISPVFSWAQKSFNIEGRIEGISDEAKIFINYVAGEERKIDSFKVKNGLFKIKGRAILPTTAQLRLRHNNSPLSDDPSLRTPLDILSIYIDENKISIHTTDSLKNAVISNSKINDDFKDLEARFVQVKKTTLKLRTELYELQNDSSAQTEKIHFLKDQLDSIDKIRVEKYLLFAKEKSDSYIGLVALNGAIADDLEPSVIQPLFERFSEAHRSSALGVQILSSIERARKTSIGATVDFQQTDTQGQLVRLSDYRGKYVLVDFWASWCLPCREENPNLVKAYEMYGGKTFEIIGVSLDRMDGRQFWLEAIRDDKLTWPQLSDLQFWNNAVVKQFDIANIPFNFLVDPEGKIVAKNLKGKYLLQELAEILPDSKD